jgi:hypothetical protein
MLLEYLRRKDPALSSQIGKFIPSEGDIAALEDD